MYMQMISKTLKKIIPILLYIACVHQQVPCRKLYRSKLTDKQKVFSWSWRTPFPIHRTRYQNHFHQKCAAQTHTYTKHYFTVCVNSISDECWKIFSLAPTQMHHINKLSAHDNSSENCCTSIQIQIHNKNVFAYSSSFSFICK